MKIPKKFQSVLWSANVALLNPKKDEYYIIHQIFAYGSLEEIHWVFQNYPAKEIVKVFQEYFKDYRRERFYFVKNILLGLDDWKPDERYYVKNTPRIIG